MKKLLFLLLSMFAVLGFVGCDGEEPTLPTTVEEEVTLQLDEPLSVPQGLAINEVTKTLTWQAVPNATAYNVYVNGVLKTEVTGTSYDFSSLTETQIIFTVKALGGPGFLNSNHSTTIAYVVDLQEEIDSMMSVLVATGLTVGNPEAFAEEMVSKGMLSDDFEAMMLNMSLVMTMMEMEDMSEMYGVVDQVMDSMDITMVEALVSALIKVQLPVLLEEELLYLQEHDGECLEEDYWGECYWYADYSQDIMMLEATLDFIENNGDEAVSSVMVLVQYIMDVQDSISNDMINNIESLTNAAMGDMNNFTQNINLLVSIKNDMVNNLKEHLPSVEDFVLLNQTMTAFMSIMTEDVIEFESPISVAQQAALARYSIELMFNVLLEIDAVYLQTIIGLSMNASSLEGLASEFLKQNIRLLNNILVNNEDLLDEMSMVLSTTNKIDMLTEILVMSFSQTLILEGIYDETNLPEEAIRNLITSNMNFEALFILQDSLGDTFTKLINNIVESDYAIIDLMVQIAAVSSGGYNLVENDDYYGMNFRINYEVEPGIYYLIVKGYDEESVGNISVFIYGNEELMVNENQFLDYDGMFVYEIAVTETTYLEAYTEGSTDTYGILMTEEQYAPSSGSSDQVSLVFDLIREVTSLINPIIQSTDDADYQALIDTIFSTGITGILFAEMINEEAIPAPAGLVQSIYDAMSATSDDQFGIFKNLFNTMSKTQYIDQLEVLASAIEEDETAMYGLAILMANIYLDFYNASDDHLDNIMDAVVDVLSDPEIMALTEMTTEDIEMVEAMFGELFSSIAQQANIIKGYNYQNLTSQQMENVMNFMAIFGAFVGF